MRSNVIRWLFDGRLGPAARLAPRWIFLRLLVSILAEKSAFCWTKIPPPVNIPRQSRGLYGVSRSKRLL